MTTTQKLNELFHRWQTEYPEYQGKFASDGIINETLYNNQKLRLLFIAKEPNDPEQNGGDFRNWWSEEVKFSFSHRICEWAFGLLNSFPPLNALSYDNKERVQILNSIAFMNLKKIGGGSGADHEVIKEVVSRERLLLSEEIEIIKPHIIVGGLGNSELWEPLFPGIKFEDTGFDIKVARYNSYKIIDYYHPSYRVPRAMNYSLLGRVYESKVFQQL